MVALSRIEFRNAVARAAGHPCRVELRVDPGRPAMPQLLAYDAEGRLAALLPVPAAATEDPGRMVVDLSADLRVRVSALGVMDLAGGTVEGPALVGLNPLKPRVLAVDGPLAGQSSVRPARDDGCALEVSMTLAKPAAGDRRRLRGGSALAFTAGTMIATPGGERPIESLAPGDLVSTRDSGDQAVRLVLREDHDPATFRTNRDLWPVRIAAGALGFGAPTRDLWVAAGERLIFSHIRLGLTFDDPSAMVRAKSLAAFLDRVDVDPSLESATYYHLVLDSHAVIFANGAGAESLRPEPALLPRLTVEAQALLLAAFPEVAAGGSQPEMAYPTLRSWEVMAAVA